MSCSVLAMSATIAAERVAALLGGAPVVTAETKAYPVDLRWVPRRPKDRLEPAVADAVRRALRENDGDLLVFLPGAGEIRRTFGILTLRADAHAPPQIGEQRAGIEPGGRGRDRRIA